MLRNRTLSARARFTLATAATVGLGALATQSFAQTSGNTAVQGTAAVNWTAAPWTITAGAGTFPDSGGTATWNTIVAGTPGTVGAAGTLALNQAITLAGLVYNSPYSLTVTGSAVNNLTLPATGGTLEADLSIANTPSLTQLANSITAPITGGGTVGLTKTGNYTATLGATANSTYTGGTHVNGGTLILNVTAAIGDNALGASGAGNGISMNGGNIFNAVTSGWTTSRAIFLDTGGGTIWFDTAGTFSGVISGSGTLCDGGFAAVAMNLTGANTYTGATVLNSSASILNLLGNGQINQSTSYDLSGSITLNNTATNNSDRLTDTAAISDRGSVFAMTGNATAATSEVAGALTVTNGLGIFTLTPNAAQQESLTLASVSRQNNATMYMRGTNLGAAPANGVAQLISTASPSGGVVGGGGTAGTTTISIVPFAAGDISAATFANSSFVTWDSTSGAFRPLNTTTEYAALASGANSQDNTKVSVATAITAPTTVNSVLVTGTGAAALLTGTGGLNITSGALMSSPATGVGSATISANINFGSAEGVVSATGGAANTNASGLTLSGVISGTNGITLNGITGANISLTGANTYTGTTTLINGITNVTGTIANDGVTPSIFGEDTSAVVLAGGNNANITGMWATAATTFNRDLKVVGANTADQLLNSANPFTINGNINIAATDNILFQNAGSGSATNAFILNGNISGDGGLEDIAGTTFVYLSGNNTFTGGVNVGSATYAAGSDSAFGTGTIYFSSTGKIQSKDATAHTISNGVMLAANITVQGTGALNFTGPINLNGSRSFAVTNTANTTFSGLVQNGGLTKTGTGKLILSDPTGNTYSGGTVLGNGAGILNVNNTSGSGTGTGAVSIGTTSTLSGTFIIAGNTTINGNLAPGNSPGTAHFLGNLTDGTTANTMMELASLSSFDRLIVDALLTLKGSVTVTALGGYVPNPGDSFDLVDWGSLDSSGFSIANLNLAGAPLPVGESWDTSQFLITGTISVTPEPGTIMLATLGGLSLLGRRRRRN